MSNFTLVRGPGPGLFFDNDFCTGYNRTNGTVAIGDVLMFDRLGTEGTSTTPGSSSHPFANLIKPTTAGVGGLSGVANARGGFFGVVVDLLDGAGADNALVKVQVRGMVDALLNTASNLSVGDELVAVNAQVYLAEGYTAGHKVIAWSMIADADTDAGQKCRVLFNGIEGLGAMAAS